MFTNEPINNIKWVDAKELNMNDYNPNTVLNQELKLLEFSILKNGWIQPIIIGNDKVIIDGFHRALLSKQSKKIKEKYDGKVPCVVMDMSVAERKMLTIRINRAKGVHNGYKMHSIVQSLISEHKLEKSYVAKSLGMSKKELELLLKDDVFDKLDIKNHKYSMAWVTSK